MEPGLCFALSLAHNSLVRRPTKAFGADIANGRDDRNARGAMLNKLEHGPFNVARSQGMVQPAWPMVPNEPTECGQRNNC